MLRMASARLSVGIALTTDPDRTRGELERFCGALGDALGIEAQARGVWHYHHLLEALSDGEVDLVWLPPVLALRATADRHSVPIALPVRHGVSTYSAALFTRADSEVRGIEDLKKGVTAAWVDRQSAAGYLIIRALLRSKGLDLGAAFCHEKFLGTHDAVADAVFEGEVDVGATFVYLDPDASTGAPKKAGWGERAAHMICFAGPIPSDVLAVRRKLAPDLQHRIQQVLVGPVAPKVVASARRLLSADGFVAPDRVHLERLTEILNNLESPRSMAHAIRSET